MSHQLARTVIEIEYEFVHVHVHQWNNIAKQRPLRFSKIIQFL